MMSRARTTLLCLPLMLAACGGVFESKMAAPQAYVLRLPPATAPAADAPTAGTLLVRRPDAGPGLNTDRIALIRGDRRFDVYAASRWAAPVPVLMESVLVDSLRGTGRYSAVLDDAAPFAPYYDLRVAIRRFEADYTAAGNGDAPTVHVVLDCTLGRRRDRHLLSTFTVSGSARAGDDRLGQVVAAFEAATAAAVAELQRALEAAVAAESAARAAASEGR